jgi:Rieske Fe-S protein
MRTMREHVAMLAIMTSDARKPTASNGSEADMHDPFAAPGNPPDRRSFLRLGLAAAVATIAAGCSPSQHRSRPTSTSAPPLTESTLSGGRIDAGDVEQIRARIAATHQPYYLVDARAYVSTFPAKLASKARGVYPAPTIPLLQAGLVVLQQKCPHEGCRVPFCVSSQYFECPCDGSKFSAAGEKRAGPAPRGMTFVDADIEHGHLIINPAKTYPGVAIGVDVTKQQPAGPLCV